MERVILVLAMLAGLHLLLSFLRSARTRPQGAGLNRNPKRRHARAGEGHRTHWQQYDRPAYQRRTGIDIDPAKSGEASFEVIA
jgi:hypothetical protein